MKKIKIIILMCMCLIILPTNIFAQEVGSGVDFSVEIINNKDQLDSDVSYYHLNLKKNQTNEVSFIIHNFSENDKEFLIDFERAGTDSNGNIVYKDDINKRANKSLQYNIEDFVTLKNDTLTVPAKSSETITAKISIGNVEFSGILLGAFRIFEKNNDINSSQNEGIKQLFGYEIGLVLTQSESPELPNSKIFELGEVKVNLNEGFKVLEYKINNLDSQIARNLDIKTKLTNLSEDTIIFDKKVENYSIAPNGVLPLELNWEKREVKSGAYLLQIEMNDNEDDYWSWEYEFEINDAEAKDLNDNATYKVEYPKWTYFIFIILVVLTFANFVILKKRAEK